MPDSRSGWVWTNDESGKRAFPVMGWCVDGDRMYPVVLWTNGEIRAEKGVAALWYDQDAWFKLVSDLGA